MKPFYTNQMLIECNTSEIQYLRIAVANEMERWSDKDDEGKPVFPETYKAFIKLYNDITRILEQMPWNLDKDLDDNRDKERF